MAARVVLAVLMVVIAAAVGTVAGAQSRAAEGKTPACDVASIRTNRTRTDSRGVSTQPGRLIITGLTVREIVAFAYGIPNPLRYSRISGGSKWLDSDRFDIIAKADEGASTDRLRLMLRALLADRFRWSRGTRLQNCRSTRSDSHGAMARWGRVFVVRRTSIAFASWPIAAECLRRCRAIRRMCRRASSGLSPV